MGFKLEPPSHRAWRKILAGSVMQEVGDIGTGVLRALLLCLFILAAAFPAGAQLEQGDGLGLMLLRLQSAEVLSGSVPGLPQRIVQEVLGQNRGAQHPHVIGLMGVRDATEVEELIWPLNRALRPDQASYVTWLSSGGHDGKKMAILSLFPLVGYEDLFERGSGCRVLYSILDASTCHLHVILVSGDGIASEETGEGAHVEKRVARLLGVIMRQDAKARIVLMGDLRPDVLFQYLPERASWRCVFCPKLGKTPEGAMMVHPAVAGPGKVADEAILKGKSSVGVKVRWAQAER